MLYQVNGEYHFTPDYDFFVKKGVIKSKPDGFNEKLLADAAIILAIEKGAFSFLKTNEKTKFNAPNVISDDLGTRGVLNPATGKMHDSKSSYYKDVRAAGCEIMGNDAKVKVRTEIQGNYDCSKELSQAIDQTGFMDKIKRKK